MSHEEKADFPAYKVLINHEEQYSLWPAHLKIPRGWNECASGTKEECLAYVRQSWTDMRPLSLRLKMQEQSSRID
jgi:MbtH protein